MEFLWNDSWLSMAQMYDKWGHAAGSSLILCMLWIGLRAYHALRNLPRAITRDWPFRLLGRLWLMVVMGGIGFEIAQRIISPIDIMANIIGATIALLALRSAARTRRC